MSRTFQEYVQDDRIRRYVEYKADEWGVPYVEAARRSLGRMYAAIASNPRSPIAILTAFRGERPLMANRAMNRELEGDLRRLGWGYVPVMGGFVEKVRDAEGKETGEAKKIDSEESYVVTGPMDNPERFRSDLGGLLHKYGQEAAVMKLPGDENAYLLNANGTIMSIGKWSNNKMADYFTRMVKGPPGRQWNFEAAGDDSRTTRMLVDKFFEARNASRTSE
jgi:hypothetical protein